MKKQLINLNPVKDKVKEKLLEKYDTTLFMNTSKIELKLDIEDILDEYIEQQNIVEPTVYITANAYIKMRMLVDKTDKEVGWYGIVKEMPGLESTYVIEDIVVYPQKVTGATVEQDEDRMFEFETSLTTDEVNHKRFHGHSHVNMTTGPSAVDENFYQELLSQVTDYFIITITNKRSEYTTRFYDMQNNILYTDVAIHLIQDNGVPYMDWYNEVKEEVKEPVNVIDREGYIKQTKSKTKQETLFDEPFWDPYTKDWITAEDYETIYDQPYQGQYDNFKKGGKKHGNYKRN